MDALAAVLQRNRDVELLLLKLRREQVGKRSERLNPDQLQLLFEELRAMSQPEPVAEPDDAEDKADALLDKEIEANRSKPDKQRRDRKPRTDYTAGDIQRDSKEIEVPAEQRACALCGGERRTIGHDVTRSLEFVPASFVEHEHRLEKLACPRCKEGITTAPGPERVLSRSMADASLLAHIVVSKYVDHMPLLRLQRQYRRYGVDIPLSTLADWVRGVADLLGPLAELQMERVLSAHVVATDATGLKVLDPEHPENICKGTMWCLVGDERDVVFRYTKTGEGESGPWSFLGGRKGFIQSDAANVFDRLFNGKVSTATWVGCWAHARRGIFQLKDTDPRVARPLRLIRRLYRIETLADVKGLAPDARAKLRRERAGPTLEKLKLVLAATVINEPPDSALSKAVAYIINHWEGLTRFLDDGRLSLDNNCCERQLRDIALGRKNYLFAGSHEAAERKAILYGLLRTCAAYDVPPLLWLTDVLRKIAAGWKQSALDELLPQRWLELHAPAEALSA